jgi:AAA domain
MFTPHSAEPANDDLAALAPLDPTPCAATAMPASPIAPYHPLKLAGLRAAEAPVAWLWEGFLARGGVTLLTSLWKAGKTTLVSIFLDRMRQGGILAGRAVHPGRAIVLSEKSPSHWEERSQTLGFGDHITWLCRPFQGKPTREDWLALIDRLVALHAREPFDLLVIDPLATFLPGRDENNAANMLEIMMPLQRITALRIAVLIPHHPTKRPSPAGHAARGSGALPGFADILIEMDRLNPSDDLDRRRRLRAYSRFRQTPAHTLIELTDDCTDYRFLGDFAQAEFLNDWERLRRVFETANVKLRREEILEDWPDDDLRPAGITLRRWLERALEKGHIAREGAGTKGDPYLYWIPELEKTWCTDPLAHLLQPFDTDKYLNEMTRQELRQCRRPT